MRRNNDKKLLERLIFKYGKSNINLAINSLNENLEDMTLSEIIKNIAYPKKISI